MAELRPQQFKAPSGDSIHNLSTIRAKPDDDRTGSGSALQPKVSSKVLVWVAQPLPLLLWSTAMLPNSICAVYRRNCTAQDVTAILDPRYEVRYRCMTARADLPTAAWPGPARLGQLDQICA